MRDEWENKASIDSIESGIGMNDLAFCSGHNAPSHLQNLRNRLLTWRDHGQANRNITYASTRGFLLSTTMDTLDSQLCVFEHWELSPVQRYLITATICRLSVADNPSTVKRMYLLSERTGKLCMLSNGNRHQHTGIYIYNTTARTFSTRARNYWKLIRLCTIFVLFFHFVNTSLWYAPVE